MTAADVPAGPAGEPGPQPAADRRTALVDRYLRGELSGEMTLMYCLQAVPDAHALRDLIGRPGAGGVDASGGARRTAPTEASGRLSGLRTLLDANFDGCERIAAMLRSGVDSDQPAATVGEGIAFSRRLFDWSVSQSSETSVALYSLGNPRILAAATDEIAALLRAWGVVRPGSDWLEIGCGIGRFQQALAPHVRSITGIDVSPRMIEAARQRCAGLANVTLQECTGRDLADFDDASLDVVLAVDAFAYIVQSGMPLAERHFAEARRVLRPGGDFVILEFSYRGRLDEDRADVRRLAADAGLDVRVCGTQPLTLWDGAAFHMRRSGS